jgi:hypothetical protein
MPKREAPKAKKDTGSSDTEVKQKPDTFAQTQERLKQPTTYINTVSIYLNLLLCLYLHYLTIALCLDLPILYS